MENDEPDVHFYHFYFKSSMKNVFTQRCDKKGCYSAVLRNVQLFANKNPRFKRAVNDNHRPYQILGRQVKDFSLITFDIERRHMSSRTVRYLRNLLAYLLESIGRRNNRSHENHHAMSISKYTSLKIQYYIVIKKIY